MRSPLETMPQPETTIRVPATPGTSRSRALSQMSSTAGTTVCTTPSRGSWRPERSVSAVASTVCAAAPAGSATTSAAAIALVFHIDHPVHVGAAHLDRAAGDDGRGVALHAVGEDEPRVVRRRRRRDPVARAAGDRALAFAPGRLRAAMTVV